MGSRHVWRHSILPENAWGSPQCLPCPKTLTPTGNQEVGALSCKVTLATDLSVDIADWVHGNSSHPSTQVGWDSLVIFVSANLWPLLPPGWLEWWTLGSPWTQGRIHPTITKVAKLFLLKARWTCFSFHLVWSFGYCLCPVHWPWGWCNTLRSPYQIYPRNLKW